MLNRARRFAMPRAAVRSVARGAVWSATGAGASAFSPLDYEPAGAWDYSDPANMLDAGGAAADIDEGIATLVDITGNGFDLVQQADANDRPLRKAGWVQFDGVDDYLTTSGQSPADLITGPASTVIMVMALRAFTNNNFIWDTVGSTVRALGIVNTTAGNQLRGQGTNPTTGTDLLTTDVFFVACWRHNTNFVGVTINNGTEKSSTPTITPGASFFTLGGNGAIPAAACSPLNWKAHYVFNEFLDIEKCQKAMNWLIAKHNIAVPIVAGGFFLVAGGFKLVTTL